MTRYQIIDKLRPYLDSLYISRLEFAVSINKNLVLCMVITDILKDVELEENEEFVCELLSKLVSISFSSRRK